MIQDPIFQSYPDGISLNIPISEGGWVFLTLLAIGIAFTALLGLIRTIQSPPAWTKRLRLHEKRGLNGLGWFAAILAPIWFALLLTVLWALFRIVMEFPAVDADQDGTNLRWHVLSLVGLLTALGGLVGTPLALIRVFTNERQTSVAEQSHLTDQINKAVENIGALDSEGNPSIEVRIGGLLALERISKQNPSEHIQIMEIICAYVRKNAPISSLDGSEIAEIADLQTGLSAKERASHAQIIIDRANEIGDRAKRLSAPQEDICSALLILGRRGREQIKTERQHLSDTSPQGYRLDLRNSRLQGADLSRYDLEHALLQGAHLQGANLQETRLNNADLRNARLGGANLTSAHLEHVNAQYCRFESANLRHTKLQRSNLWLARLERATMRGADANGINLNSACLIDADLREVNLEKATLTNAHLGLAQVVDSGLAETDWTGANMELAELSGSDARGARFIGSKMYHTNIGWANFEGAIFKSTRFEDVNQMTQSNFSGAAFFGVNLSNTRISEAQIWSAFGDATVTLPNVSGPDCPNWPDHWAKTELNNHPDPAESEFHQAWRAWQDEIGFDREAFEIKQPEK